MYPTRSQGEMSMPAVQVVVGLALTIAAFALVSFGVGF